jgi:lipopolysaccharide/colanic/teichoic acid biosynthesis glycosyltransferase
LNVLKWLIKLIKTEELQFKNVIISQKYLFWKSKRIFDVLICISLLPVLALIILILLIFNKFYNKGSLFYVQKRMGKNCKPFNAIKFRTMSYVKVINRKYSDPVELDRITALGHKLRKIRIDELPQILNVLKGDMSLIGPRPDYYEHALLFLENIPSYKFRYAIKPGISGLAQIRLGYAAGLNETKKKSKVDVFYIENASYYLDMKIFFGTILTILKGTGT